MNYILSALGIHLRFIASRGLNPQKSYLKRYFIVFTNSKQFRSFGVYRNSRMEICSQFFMSSDEVIEMDLFVLLEKPVCLLV